MAPFHSRDLHTFGENIGKEPGTLLWGKAANAPLAFGPCKTGVGLHDFIFSAHPSRFCFWVFVLLHHIGIREND